MIDRAASNLLGDLACQRISKHSLSNLSHLDLSNNAHIFLGFNKISDLGCKYLTRGCWPQLSILYLGTEATYLQTSMRSPTTAANGSV